MNNLKKLDIKNTLVMFFAADAVLWLILVIMKAFGWVSHSWLVVLLGVVWIPLYQFACSAAAVCILLTVNKVKETIRKRKLARRIKAQAKAVGAWDNYTVLGGYALDLKAKELNITREPGETDRELRVRIAKLYESMTHEARRQADISIKKEPPEAQV